jgi:signal transduction histidine kinase
MPICRAEGIHPDNIRIFGTFPRIYVDNRAFMQVFYNLMTNAIKYRDKDDPKSFSIQVSSKLVEHPEDLTDRWNLDLGRIWKRMVDGGYIRKGAHLVDFSDFGVGIEEDEITKVFWEGFRSPLISAQEIRGSGIGLTIVRNILADFDSLIWVESRQSPTIFRVMIPDIVESSNYTRRDRARSWRDG